METLDYRDRFDVLIVEDNPYDSELTIEGIKRENKKLNLIHLWDGLEVVKFIEAKPPYEKMNAKDLRLILLNLGLPKLNGMEVLKEIRNNEQTKFIPVVILTASEGNREIGEAYKLGANSFVIKPTRFESYVRRISELILYWRDVNVVPT